MSKEKKEVEKKKSTKEKKTPKKEGIFKKIKKYFKGVFKECKMIKWTNGKDMIKYSTAAIVFVIFFCLYFYIIELATAFVRSLI